MSTPEHIAKLTEAHTDAHKDLLELSKSLQDLIDKTVRLEKNTSKYDLLWSGAVGPTGSIRTSKPMTDYDFIIVGFDFLATWNHNVVILRETIVSRHIQNNLKRIILK